MIRLILILDLNLLRVKKKLQMSMQKKISNNLEVANQK